MKIVPFKRITARSAGAVIILTLFFISGADAEIYSWTDASGVRHFGDAPVIGSEADANISYNELQEIASKRSHTQGRHQSSSKALRMWSYRNRSPHMHYYTQPEPNSLFAAAAAGDLELLKSYISQDPSGLTAVDASGETVLHHAAGGKIRMILCSTLNGLISSKVERELNEELRENLPVIEYLVKKGADIDKTSKCGNTPLHIAVFTKQYAITQQLLTLNADPNIVNRPCSNAMMSSGTPLHVALNNSAIPFIKKNLVNLLLKNGAEVDIQDEDGSTPLHYAVNKNSIKLIDKMLAKGATADAVNRLNESVLFFAAGICSRTVCERIIQAGSDYKMANTQGMTPLHVAAIAANMEVVELLIQKGADPGALNSKGQTPFFLAARSGEREKMVDLLEKYNKPILKASAGSEN